MCSYCSKSIFHFFWKNRAYPLLTGEGHTACGFSWTLFNKWKQDKLTAEVMEWQKAKRSHVTEVQERKWYSLEMILALGYAELSGVEDQVSNVSPAIPIGYIFCLREKGIKHSSPLLWVKCWYDAMKNCASVSEIVSESHSLTMSLHFPVYILVEQYYKGKFNALSDTIQLRSFSVIGLPSC